MALLGDWEDKVDGVDFINADDVNMIANELITTQEDINGLRSTVGGLEDNIISGDGRITTLESQVDSLQSDVSSINSLSTSNSNDIETLGTRTTTLESAKDTIVNDISALDSRVFGTEVDITSLYGYAGSNEGRIGTLEVDVLKLKTPDIGVLIEEITVATDGIQTIIRNTEPDGKAYNFKSVSVCVEKTPWEVANVVVSEIYDMNSNKLTSYRASLTGSETAGKFQQAYYDDYAGHWSAIGCFGTPQGSPMTAQIWKSPQIYNGETITEVRVYGNTTAFEIGTVIRIYGVRA